jgi:hypothetical protein
MKICVYCASSATVDKSYFDATERLAREFLKENIDVVCGGGAVGLMGGPARGNRDARGIAGSSIDENSIIFRRLSLRAMVYGSPIVRSHRREVGSTRARRRLEQAI